MLLGESEIGVGEQQSTEEEEQRDEVVSKPMQQEQDVSKPLPCTEQSPNHASNSKCIHLQSQQLTYIFVFYSYSTK